MDVSIAAQPDPRSSRPEAIRLALRDGLTGLGHLPHRQDPEGANQPQKGRPMLYEFHLKRGDGTSIKEPFTAVNDKKAILRIESALERHADQSPGGTYKLLDARGREVVRETNVPKVV